MAVNEDWAAQQGYVPFTGTGKPVGGVKIGGKWFWKPERQGGTHYQQKMYEKYGMPDTGAGAVPGAVDPGAHPSQRGAMPDWTNPVTDPFNPQHQPQPQPQPDGQGGWGDTMMDWVDQAQQGIQDWWKSVLPPQGGGMPGEQGAGQFSVPPQPHPDQLHNTGLRPGVELPPPMPPGGYQNPPTPNYLDPLGGAMQQHQGIGLHPGPPWQGMPMNQGGYQPNNPNIPPPTAPQQPAPPQHPIGGAVPPGVASTGQQQGTVPYQNSVTDGTNPFGGQQQQAPYMQQTQPFPQTMAMGGGMKQQADGTQTVGGRMTQPSPLMSMPPGGPQGNGQPEQQKLGFNTYQPGMAVPFGGQNSGGSGAAAPRPFMQTEDRPPQSRGRIPSGSEIPDHPMNPRPARDRLGWVPEHWDMAGNPFSNPVQDLAYIENPYYDSHGFGPRAFNSAGWGWFNEALDKFGMTAPGETPWDQVRERDNLPGLRGDKVWDHFKPYDGPTLPRMPFLPYFDQEAYGRDRENWAMMAREMGFQPRMERVWSSDGAPGYSVGFGPTPPEKFSYKNKVTGWHHQPSNQFYDAGQDVPWEQYRVPVRPDRADYWSRPSLPPGFPDFPGFPGWWPPQPEPQPPVKPPGQRPPVKPPGYGGPGWWPPQPPVKPPGQRPPVKPPGQRPPVKPPGRPGGGPSYAPDWVDLSPGQPKLMVMVDWINDITGERKQVTSGYGPPVGSEGWRPFRQGGGQQPIDPGGIPSDDGQQVGRPPVGGVIPPPPPGGWDKFPEHWGQPPRLQDRGPQVKLPGNYGWGQGSIIGWIQRKMEEDARVDRGQQPIDPGGGQDGWWGPSAPGRRDRVWHPGGKPVWWPAAAGTSGQQPIDPGGIPSDDPPDGKYFISSRPGGQIPGYEFRQGPQGEGFYWVGNQQRGGGVPLPGQGGRLPGGGAPGGAPDPIWGGPGPAPDWRDTPDVKPRQAGKGKNRPPWAKDPKMSNPLNSTNYRQPNTTQGWATWWKEHYSWGANKSVTHAKNTILGKDPGDGRGRRGGLVLWGEEKLARRIYEEEKREYVARIGGDSDTAAYARQSRNLYQRALGLIHMGLFSAEGHPDYNMGSEKRAMEKKRAKRKRIRDRDEANQRAIDEASKALTEQAKKRREEENRQREKHGLPPIPWEPVPSFRPPGAVGAR
tara:strand:+ start:32540 stop:36028 length:3489 start_codon:yes stop_codon:yes gene_type:complete